ncbi:MAG: lytic transglycosylase domain-containing protein [Monoglobaceae bacterium]
MRSVQSGARRKKRNSGCGAGFFVFVLFLAAIILIVWLAVRNTGGIMEKIRKTQYPIKYEHFVETYAAKFELEPSLVYGVIRTESDFDVYAVSSAQAKGLMQITDETGKDCAKKLKLTKYSDDMLFDPETNIMLGCYYLSSLIKKYEHIENALAAYNGGPGNADGWLKDPGITDSNGKLVNIPFDETRTYVERVLEARDMYKSLYGLK